MSPAAYRARQLVELAQGLEHEAGAPERGVRGGLERARREAQVRRLPSAARSTASSTVVGRLLGGGLRDLAVAVGLGVGGRGAGG